MRKLVWLALVAVLWSSSAWAANGDVINQGFISPSPEQRTWKMIDAIAATSSGAWVNFQGFTLGQLHVDGVTTATLQVRGSNALNKPDDATEDGEQVGSNITADGFTTITGPFRWLKVKISSHSSGTITALLTATTFGGGGSTASSGSVTQGTSPWVTTGTQTDNTANSTAKIAAIPCVVSASAASYTDGRMVPCTTDTDGAMWVKVRDSGMSVDYYPGTAASNQDQNAIKSSAGVLYGLTCTSIDDTVVYVKLYETDAPTSASTVKMKFAISGRPASGQIGGMHAMFGPDGVAFATGIGSRYTTGFADNDTNAVTTGEVICHFYYR